MCSALFEVHAKHRLVTNAVHKNCLLELGRFVGKNKKLRAGRPNFHWVN